MTLKNNTKVLEYFTNMSCIHNKLINMIFCALKNSRKLFILAAIFSHGLY